MRSFARYRNTFSHPKTDSSLPHLLDKDIARESISKMTNGKATVTSGVVAGMVRWAGEEGADTINDLVNLITAGVIPAGRERSTIVNW